VRQAIDVDDDAARRRFRRDAARVGRDAGLVVWPAVEVEIAEDGAVLDATGFRAAGFVVVGDATPVPGLAKEAATARLLKAVASGQLHALARVQGRVLPDDDVGADLDLRAVLQACARRRVVVEVSGEPARPDLEAKACRVAGEVGALLALSARPAVVDDVSALRFALWQARRGWATAAATINALPAEQARAFFGLAAPVDTDDDDDASIDADDDRDPLFAPARRTELRARLAAFLQGQDDDELRRALETRGGHPLQAAFALLASADADDDIHT
jgi:histidinol phosphatase-like PHP family hydrolase